MTVFIVVVVVLFGTILVLFCYVCVLVRNESYRQREVLLVLPCRLPRAHTVIVLDTCIYTSTICSTISWNSAL